MRRQSYVHVQEIERIVSKKGKGWVRCWTLPPPSDYDENAMVESLDTSSTPAYALRDVEFRDVLVPPRFQIYVHRIYTYYSYE